MTIRSVGDIPGLSSREVAERIGRGERNRFSLRPTRSYAQIIWSNVFNLYTVVLLGAFLVLLLIRGPGSSIFPAGIVIINVVLGLVQEVRAKRALDQLATLSARTVSVRRNGTSAVVPVTEIVRDDVVEIRPGDSIVVDGPVLASDGLEIDESQLTGESEYIEKHPGEKLTSGSFCVSGSGLMQAEEIGARSYVNHLANVARTYKNVRTPLEQQLDLLVKLLVAVMIIVAPLTFLGGQARGLALADSFENVVNLMSSLVPQGLLVFVAISFAYGVVSISRLRALIQRPNAIELMGHIQCLCADKTGTLTQNRLTVKQLIPLAGQDPRIVRDRLADYAANVSWHNRTVGAIAAYVDGHSGKSARIAEVPFNSGRRWSSVTLASGETLLLGAPEVLLEDTAQQAEADRLSRQGLRIVAFGASREPFRGSSEPGGIQGLALIALQDELRPDIAQTLDEFARQHIAIKIISGDSPETIRSIAQQAGMDEKNVLTGADLDGMDAGQLDEQARQTNLFARITPQAKRRLISSLAKDGPVAMIGDGVNDVPALKQASLAIAMNDGAQIAKDVSDIILLNNAFSTLPRAFFEGREITQRLYGIARITLVRVLYLTILFVLSGYAGLPWPANLLQTTWLSLVTLTAPAMLIIFRALPAPPGQNRTGEVIRYVLTWGVVGAAALLLLDAVTINLFKDSLPASRAVIIAFAGIYNSMVLWDIYGVTPFAPVSFVRHPAPAIAAVVFGVIVAFVPPYFFPYALGFAPMGLRDLALLGVVVCLASFAVWLLRIRTAPENLHLPKHF